MSLIIYSLILLFVIGGLIPSIIQALTDVSSVTLSGIYLLMSNFLNDGISIFSIDFDIFFFIGNDAKDFITENIRGLQLLSNSFPDFMMVVFILIFVLFVIGVINVIRG